MPNRKDLILERLAAEGAKTLALFRSLTPNQWQQQVYSVGPEWGARDLLCHFISAERTLVAYHQDLVNGGLGVPHDFEIDAFNAKEVQALREANHSAETLMAEFERSRAAIIALVHTLTDSDFDRIGFHPWFGETQLEAMLKLVYRHSLLHQRDLKKALELGRPVPHVDTEALIKQTRAPR